MLELKSDRLALSEGAAHALSLCGKTFVADLSGALYWPGQATLVVADLHLEKASAAAERGRLLPPYDTRETLMKLAHVIDRYEPTTIVALGDSLHDKRAATRLSDDNLQVLSMLREDRSWIWVTGNHDPVIAPELGGEVCSELTLDGITLRHEPRSGRMSHEIAGHLHPAAKVSMYGHSVRRPCFVGNGRRLVMPAFGAFTGGLNVMNDAFNPVFGSDGLNVLVLGQESLYPVAARLLRDD